MLFQQTALSRRRLLAGLGASVTLTALPPLGLAQTGTGDGFRVLRAKAGTVPLRGPHERPTPIWGYDGISPGPLLRVKQGEELKIRLVNELKQPTVIHWHGLRIDNAMDGVPHLTQHPVAPGESFDYRFTPPDAGTFWYHTHFLSSEQLERGLYGPLIVDEAMPVKVDRDLTLVLDDWRLTASGEIDPNFGNMHDAMMEGRLGQYATINSHDLFDIKLRVNERVRLRLINAANARIFRLRITNHETRVMAVDGQPCPPEMIADGWLRLGPGARTDLFLDATLKPGATARIVVDNGRGGEFDIGTIAYDNAAPLREAPLPAPDALPANPLPAELDLKAALTVDIPLDGGMGMMMGGGMMGGMGRGMRGDMGPGRFDGFGLAPRERLWALASIASSGHDGPPLFSVERGRTVLLNFVNRSLMPHAMHVHGHHFRQISGSDLKPCWLDTVIVDPERSEHVAFVADNPGKWMVHCHMIEHLATGMAAWFEVT